jgi:type IV secretion system protein VirB6
MSDCATLIAAAGSGVGPTLMAVDCMTASAGAGSFGRVLGPQGVLAPALTAALTIYVAAYGLALITGRVRLGLGGLSGRMLGIGLVLAFATSWVVYGPLVYGLATSAPDEVAGAILGSHGSATATFAQRIDTLFAAVGDATREAAQQDAERSAQLAAQPQVPGAPPVLPPRANTSQTAGFAPASVAMIGALVLLLSTVGVLVTARIVLAALLLVGPVFVVMALFAPVRALFGGWLRTLLLAALAPMLVVLGGAFSLELALPTVARLLGPDGIDQAAATGFFLIATVHAALMVMALRAAASMVAGWKPWAPASASALTAMPRSDPASMVIATPATAQPGTRTTLAGTRSSERETGIARSATRQITTRETTGGGLFAPAPATPAPGARRAAGIGSRFRPATTRMVVK